MGRHAGERPLNGVAGGAGSRGRRTLSLRVAAGWLVVTGIAATHPLAASAAGGGLGVAPASSDPANPTSRAYIVASLDPGSTQRSAIVVTNSGSGALSVDVAAVDGLTASTSGAVYGSGQQPPSRWGTWITPDVSALTLAPHTQATVGFTIDVPAGASAGDHLAGIAVQDASASGDGSGVSVVVRAVVGVLVQVRGPAAFHLTVGTAWVGPVSAYDHTNLVFVPLTDDGLLLGKPDISVTLSGPNGYHATSTRQLDTLLPGDTITYPLTWPQVLPPGAYQIEVHPIQKSVPASGSGPTAVAGGATPAAGSIPVLPRGATAPPAAPPPADGGAAAAPITLSPGKVTVAPAVQPPLSQILKSVAATSSFPLALLVIVGLFLLVQNRIDRRDPKLALAPAFADEDMLFQPLPRSSRPAGDGIPADGGADDGDV